MIGKGPAGGSWHRMEPNLRTLSLAAWMSLPGLDFNEWDTRQTALEELEATNMSLEANNKVNNNILQSMDNGRLLNNQRCAKCEALRAKGIVKANHAQCKCGRKSSKNNSVYEISNGNSPEKTKIHLNGVVAENGGSVPRRNLSLKRLMSKEVETRALISRVAEYYENYVTEMGLDKYFMNNAIVTSVYPIRMCFENFNGKFRKAKWFVSG